VGSASFGWSVVVELARLVADSILAGAGDAVVATDRDGTIQVWNPGAERIFGHRADEAIGRSLDLIIPERLRAAHWAGWQTVLSTGSSRYGDGDLLSVPSVRKDGGRISVEFTIIALNDENGRMIGLAALMRDVTKRFEDMKALRRELADATRRAAPAAPP
jgi:PAS domain S-box-containing protein